MSRDPYRYFRTEARDLTDQLGRSVLELERSGSAGEVVPRLLRLAHTLKGAARVVRLPAIAEQAHRIEDLLTPVRDAGRAVTRDDIDALLSLLDTITGGLVQLDQPRTEADAPAAISRPVAQPAAPRADIDELDSLIRTVVAAGAELNGLDRASEAALDAKRLVELVGEHAGEAPSSGARTASTLPHDIGERLRTLLAEIDRSLKGTQERIGRELGQLRDGVEQLRLVPAGTMFATLERAARDTAQLLGKTAAFEGLGGEMRLDGQSLRLVQDAMLQLVRNAVAHGIEAQRDRIAASKSPIGRVRVSVSRQNRHIAFRCEDDGHGIDIAALREPAAAKTGAHANISNAPLADLLRGGVSTSAFVSEAAGRGIGMDIVREAVAHLKGSFAVGTEAGKGSWFELAIPISLSSMDCLLVEAGEVKASLPMSAVRRTRLLGPRDIHETPEGEAIIESGRSLPLISLQRLMGHKVSGFGSARLSAVIVESASGLAALAVARIAGTASLVVRPLPDLAPASAAIEGASFGLDGSPIVVLNPEGIIATQGQYTRMAAGNIARKLPLLVVDDSLTTRMLEQSILESAGYEVDMAVSAEEGLERVRVRDYGLILVDVEMPGMDGFGFVTELRRDSKTRAIPAILVTSRNADDDKRRGTEVGAQDYVVKSEFDQAALLDRIRELVS